MSKELLNQALEYLEDNQHWIADGERHAYFMEYNAFIDKLKQALAQQKQPAQQEPQPEPPSDENIFDDWVSASDSDGIAYDGPSFERGYKLGQIAERDEERPRPEIRGVRSEFEAMFATPQPAQQEPVGYVAENGVVDWNVCAPPILTDLYTAPPQRTWVGLTDDEISTLWDEWKDAVCLDHKTWAKAIEAKLKEQAKEPSPIPLITDEEWEALNAEEK